MCCFFCARAWIFCLAFWWGFKSGYRYLVADISTGWDLPFLAEGVPRVTFKRAEALRISLPSTVRQHLLPRQALRYKMFRASIADSSPS